MTTQQQLQSLAVLPPGGFCLLNTNLRTVVARTFLLVDGLKIARELPAGWEVIPVTRTIRQQIANKPPHAVIVGE